MLRKSLLAVSLFAALVSSGCATMSVQREKAQAIKTVAIVGFTGITDLEDKNGPKSGVGDIMNAVNASKDVFGGDLDRRRLEQGENVYATLSSAVESTTGWKVADKKLLASDPVYTGMLRENPNLDSIAVKGLQRVPEVLRYEVASRMDARTRAELCQRLGVDAIAVARVRYVIGDKSGFALGGIGKTTIYPKAIVEWELLDGSDKPVWSDRWAEGEPTKDGFDNVMGAKSFENETQVLGAAAKSAFGKLVARYQGGGK